MPRKKEFKRVATRTCPWDRTSFDPVRITQNYCSEKCRRAAIRARRRDRPRHVSADADGAAAIEKVQSARQLAGLPELAFSPHCSAIAAIAEAEEQIRRWTLELTRRRTQLARTAPDATDLRVFIVHRSEAPSWPNGVSKIGASSAGSGFAAVVFGA